MNVNPLQAEPLPIAPKCRRKDLPQQNCPGVLASSGKPVEQVEAEREAISHVQGNQRLRGGRTENRPRSGRIAKDVELGRGRVVARDRYRPPATTMRPTRDGNSGSRGKARAMFVNGPKAKS